MANDMALPQDDAAEKILALLQSAGDLAKRAPQPAVEGDEDPAPGSDDDTDDDSSNDDSNNGPDAGSEADAPAPDDGGDAGPIAPPASWKADAKARFAALPRDLQQMIADREREREQHFSKTQNEAAQARRAADAERNAASAARQAYAHGLGTVLAVAKTTDPILAEGQRTDWAKLAAANPQAAQAKWAQYQARLGLVKNVAQEHARVAQASHADMLARAHGALGNALAFWNDPAQREAFRGQLRTFLGNHGFADGEVRGVVDPRAIVVARKAMLYDDLMAQQAKIAGARKPQANGRVLRPQASGDDGANPRANGLFKRAAKSGRLDDKAAAILAALD